MIRLGGTATPAHLTVFQGLGKLFNQQGIDMDWVLYSDDQAMIDDFVDGKIDLAWNGPLGYVKIKQRMAERCRVIAMRDMDINFTTCFITKQGSEILTVEDLKGKRFAFGSKGSPQTGLLAYYFLKDAGINPRSDLAAATFFEERPSIGLSGEGEVIARVNSGDYDAGAVALLTLQKMSEQGALDQYDVRTFWTSPGYSHCCFTAQDGIEPELYRQLEQAFLTVDYGDPLGQSVLDAEGCKAFVPGIEDGWEVIAMAAEQEGLM